MWTLRALVLLNARDETIAQEIPNANRREYECPI